MITSLGKFFDRVIEFARKFPVLKKIPINFYKFVIVGLTVFIIDFIIFNLIFHILGIQARIVLWQISDHIAIVFSLPNIISVALASVFGYILNKKWSFENTSDQVASQFGKYLAVAVFNNLINNAIFGFLLYNVFASFTWDLKIITTICKILATSFQVITSYILYKFVVFREEKEVLSEAITP